MDIIDDTRKYITLTIDDNTKWLDNSIIATLLTLGLVIYSAMFVGKVYPSGVNFFKNPLVKIIAFLIILYLSTRNIGLALVAMIAVFSIMIKTASCNCAQNEHEPFVSITTDDYEYAPINAGCICACQDGNCDCKCAGNIDFQLPGLSEEQHNESIIQQEMQTTAEQENDDQHFDQEAGELVKRIESKYLPCSKKQSRRNRSREVYEGVDDGYVDSSSGSQYAPINY